MTDEVRTKFGRTTKLLVKVYCLLAEEALQNSQRMWKMTGKFHLMEHIGQDQSKICNPKYSWCYADEDLMQIIKEVALSCHPSNLAHMTIFKWIILSFECGP